MKRQIILIVAGVLVLFAAIALLKDQPTASDSQNGENSLTLEDKAKIQRFWEVYRKARQQRLAGNLKEALGSYKSALELNPDHEDALYYFGNVSFVLGNFEDAESAWRRLVKVNPKSARAHHQLGDFYLNIEPPEFFDPEKAETEYGLALEINKEESGIHLRLGHVDLIRGDLSKAEEHFDDVIGSNFKSVEAYFLKGYVAWRQSNFTEALSMLANAKKHAEPPKPVQGVLGEGDTKAELLEQLELSKRRSMFYPFFEDISEIEQSKISKKMMDERYQKLHDFLEKVRKLNDM